MTQHVSFLTAMDRYRNRHLRDWPEFFEFTERERWDLDGAENDGRDHYVVVYFPGWWSGGVFMNDALDGTEVGPFPTGQLAWLAAETEYPNYQDADHYTMKRYAVAGRCLTTGLPTGECDHLAGVEPEGPTWDQMLGPIEEDTSIQLTTPGPDGFAIGDWVQHKDQHWTARVNTYDDHTRDLHVTDDVGDSYWTAMDAWDVIRVRRS